MCCEPIRGSGYQLATTRRRFGPKPTLHLWTGAAHPHCPVKGASFLLGLEQESEVAVHPLYYVAPAAIGYMAFAGYTGRPLWHILCGATLFGAVGVGRAVLAQVGAAVASCLSLAESTQPPPSCMTSMVLQISAWEAGSTLVFPSLRQIDESGRSTGFLVQNRNLRCKMALPAPLSSTIVVDPDCKITRCGPRSILVMFSLPQLRRASRCVA